MSNVLETVSGAAEIGVDRHGGRTRLRHLYQRSPLRVLFPDPAPGDLLTAVIVTTSGGLVGGDRLAVEASVGEGAAAHVTAQAAEKVYRSAGRDVEIRINLRAGEGGWLEYLPPETILFDGARLRRRARLERASAGCFLGGEILVFGRTARGERLGRGLVHDEWELRRDGRPVWGDAFHLDLDADREPLHSSFGLDNATACATLIYAAADAADRLPLARRVIAEAGVPGGATLISGDLLLLRFLGRDAARLRRAYAAAAGALRAVRGLPDTLPRLWHV